MSELQDAAQDLLSYYDGLAAKYGRIAEYKAVKQRMDKLRKALEGDKFEEDVEGADSWKDAYLSLKKRRDEERFDPVREWLEARKTNLQREMNDGEYRDQLALIAHLEKHMNELEGK